MKAPKFIYIVYKLDFNDNRIPGFIPQYVDFITCSKKEANIRRKMLVMAGYACDTLAFEFNVCHEYAFKNLTPGCLFNGHSKHYDELERMMYEEMCKRNRDC